MCRPRARPMSPRTLTGEVPWSAPSTLGMGDVGFATPPCLMLSRAQRARVEARTASAVHRPIPRHDRVPRPLGMRDVGVCHPPTLIASLEWESFSPTNLMLSRAQRARVEARTASAVPRPIPRHDRVPRPLGMRGRWGSPRPPIASLEWESCSHQPHAEPGAARPCRSTHGLGRAPAHPSTRPRPAAGSE